MSSQTDTVYFSTTADTVLFSYKFFQPDTTFDIYILKKHPIDTTSPLSHFKVKPTKTLQPYTDLSPDTLKKYGLTYTGVRIDPYKSKDFSIKISRTHVRKTEQCEHGKDKVVIYQANQTVKVKCNRKTVYLRTFPFMYKKVNGITEIDEKDIVRVQAWNRGNRYFICCYVRDKQILRCKDNYFETRDAGYFFIN